MNSLAAAIDYPVFRVTSRQGRKLALVVSVGTFGANASECATPIVLDAIERAQADTCSETLFGFYLRDGTGMQTVRRVRHIVSKALEHDPAVLWIRADSEAYARAALAVIRSDYHTDVVASDASPFHQDAP